MTLECTIHLIDDSTEFCTQLVEDLEEHFRGAVNLQASFAENGSNLVSIFEEKPLDLYVFDYNLGETSGEDLIRQIRSLGALTEVVFYSQDPIVHEKFKADHSVFPCGRSDAEDEVKNAITRFVERSQNISLMRGLIISEAIDLENKIDEILFVIFGDKADFFKNKVLSKAYIEFEKKKNIVVSHLKDVKNNASDKSKKAAIENLITTLGKMTDDVIRQRNILAHSSKSVGDDGVLVLESPLIRGKIRFDASWKNNIRTNIRNHSKNLSDIKVLLSELVA